MAPYEIQKMTLKELRKAFLAMMSPEWDMALIGKPEDEIAKAAQLLLALQRARLRLGNKKLSEIRDKLKNNEDALVKGKEKLDKVLSNLEKVRDVLDAIDGLVMVVGAIIDFTV